MRTSWKLGRVAGIDLYLHPTFLLLLAFIGATRGGPESILLISAVFGCVLLHELGHALMARRFGIATEDITLYPIGGVARLHRMPKAPGSELLIALAGPAVNVAIALGLAAILELGSLGGSWAESTFGEYLVYLLGMNVILALFNLVPAFPMDGGRVLRALLSGWLGRSRATAIAAGLGRTLALLFGVYSLIHGQWLQVFLAGFIYMAAGMELAQVQAEEQHREMSEGSGGVWTAPPGFSWVSRGNGVWQLAPISVRSSSRQGSSWL